MMAVGKIESAIERMIDHPAHAGLVEELIALLDAIDGDVDRECDDPPEDNGDESDFAVPNSRYHRFHDLGHLEFWIVGSLEDAEPDYY